MGNRISEVSAPNLQDLLNQAAVHTTDPGGEISPALLDVLEDLAASFRSSNNRKRLEPPDSGVRQTAPPPPAAPRHVDPYANYDLPENQFSEDHFANHQFGNDQPVTNFPRSLVLSRRNESATTPYNARNPPRGGYRAAPARKVPPKVREAMEDFLTPPPHIKAILDKIDRILIQKKQPLDEDFKQRVPDDLRAAESSQNSDQNWA